MTFQASMTLLMASPSVFWNCALILVGFVAVNDACFTTNLLFRTRIEPSSQTVMPFDDVTLTCKVLSLSEEHDYRLSYTWYRIGGDIPAKSIGKNSRKLIIPRFALADEGEYYCLSKLFGHCAKPKAATLTLDGRFVVIVMNSSLLIGRGTTAQLGIRTTGVGTLWYEWRKSGAGQLPDKVSGRDTELLTIPEVDISDEGNYSCAITNTWNVTVVSADINLATFGPPDITIHPKSQLVTSYMSIYLDCEATGLGTIEYQWESSEGNESLWMNISNSNSKRIVVKNLQESEQFRCIVSNEAGETVSKIATLTVLKIISHPQDVRAAVNSEVSFSCISSVSFNVSFSWTHNGSYIDGSSTTGDTSVLTVTGVKNSDAGSYVCTVSGESISVTSNTATLIYYVPRPKIIEPPVSQSVLVLQNATFTCNAIGYKVKYRWISISGSISSRAIGISSYRLTIVNVIPSDDGMYKCVTTNEGGRTESNVVQLRVLVNPPIIFDISISQNLDILQRAVLVCNVTGYDVSYYWTIGSGQFPSKVTGINSSTLTVPDLRSIDSNLYMCEASNLVGMVNGSIQLTVTGLPTVTVTPFYQSVEVTNDVVFTADADGVGLESFIYQWKKGDENITEEINSTLVLSNINENHSDNYTCYVSNDYGDSVVSNPVFLYVTRNLPVITLHPDNISIILTNTSTVIQLECEAEGALSYEWQTGSGKLLTGVTGWDTNILTLYNVSISDNDDYRCVATNASGSTFSYYATLLIEVKPPTIDSIMLNQGLDILQTAEFICSAAGYDVSYRWMVDSGSIPSKAFGINSNTLIVPDLRSSDSNLYICEASNLAGKVNSSKQLMVTGLPTVTVTPFYQSVEVTNEAVFMADADGVGLENFTYQWKKGDENITDEINSTLVLLNVNESHSSNYACYVSNEYGDSAVSNPVFLYVTRNLPVITLHPDNISIILTNTSTVIQLECEAVGALSYEWQTGSGKLLTGVTGWDTNILTLYNVSISDNDDYQCVATNASGSSFSYYATLLFEVKPSIIHTISISQNLSILQTAILTCNATGYDISYYWTIGSGQFPSKVTGINSSILTVPDLRSTDSNSYTCVVDNVGGSVYRVKDLIVTGLPKVSVTPLYQSREVTSEGYLFATPTGVGSDNFRYQWKKGSSNIVDGNGPVLKLENVSENDTGHYSCHVRSQYGDSAVSNAVLVNVTRNLPHITTHPSNMTIILTNTSTMVQLKCEAEGASGYEWQTQSGKLLTGVTGQNTKVLTLYNLSMVDNDEYQCKATNDSGSSFSYFATLYVEVQLPQITSSPVSQDVSLLQDAMFICSATGYNISYHWVFEPTSKPSKVMHMGVGNTTLMIPNVKSSDDGNYTCVATNIAGPIRSHAAQLTITGLPRIDVFPYTQTMEVTYNTSFIAMNVSGVGAAEFIYQWKHNGKVMAGEVDKMLLIHDIEESDGGVYQCFVTNMLGDVGTSNSAELVVTVTTPHFIHHPKSKDVELSTNSYNYSLYCEAEEAWSYYWRRQYGEIPSNAIGVGTNMLTFIDMQPENDGRYQCVARNASGNSYSNYATLIIKVREPEFIIHPTDAYAAAPFSVMFTCTAKGFGHLSIKWHRGGSLVLSNQSEQIVYFTEHTNSYIKSTIIIYNVTDDDAGEYYCTASIELKASNELKESNSTAANLYFSGYPSKPQVVKPTSLVELVQNNFHISMLCRSNVLNAQFQWEKRNDVLSPNAHGVNSSNLTIFNLIPNDSGEYRCVVSNSTGVIESEYSTLTVRERKPLMLRHPSHATVALYEPAVLSCSATSYSNMTIRWQRVGYPLPFFAATHSIESPNNVTSVLKISKMFISFFGQYYCVAKNHIGETHSASANLIQKVSCPAMVEPPQNVTISPGKTVKLTCVAHGYSSFDYVWENSYGNLSSNMRKMDTNRLELIEIAGQHLDISELVITNVDESDEGFYYCIANNTCGNDTASVWLEVDTTPTIETHPESDAFRENDTDQVVMHCLAVGMGSIQYHWEKHELSSGTWKNLSHQAYATSPNLTFSVISEEDQGIYRCVATNYDGSTESNNATLIVYGPPVIDYISSAMTSVEGNIATFTCNATNDPDAVAIYQLRIEWYRSNGDKVYQGNHTAIIVDGQITGELRSSLQFDPVDPADNGTYKCRASNHPEFYAELSTSLTVEYAPRITIDDWFNAGLFCTTKAWPEATVEWFKEDDSQPIHGSGLREKLIPVLPDTPPDTVYTCVGTNKVGSRSKSITVQDVRCTSHSAPTNGEVYYSNNGSKAHFFCDDGYNLDGEAILECVNAAWNHPPPTCVSD